MCATTPWATWWRATSAPAGSTCSIPWAGTPSACRPKTRPWTTRSIRAPGPTTTSPPCRGSSSRWACRSTGAARSRPAIPAYYRHQQKMFLDFLAAGLVERKQSKVNWDPVDHTVLANEQVIDGRGWRSGALVEQRDLTQWFFKITRYSDDLLAALDRLDRWPEKVRLMQRNWIGRSEGLLIRFALDPATTPGRRIRARGLHHPSRHDLRGEVHGGRAGPSARHRGRGEESGARRLHRRMQAPRHRRGGDRKGGEAGLRHRHRRSIRSIPPAGFRSMSPISS